MKYRIIPAALIGLAVGGLHLLVSVARGLGPWDLLPAAALGYAAGLFFWLIQTHPSGRRQRYARTAAELAVVLCVAAAVDLGIQGRTWVPAVLVVSITFTTILAVVWRPDTTSVPPSPASVDGGHRAAVVGNVVVSWAPTAQFTPLEQGLVAAGCEVAPLVEEIAVRALGWQAHAPGGRTSSPRCAEVLDVGRFWLHRSELYVTVVLGPDPEGEDTGEVLLLASLELDPKDDTQSRLVKVQVLYFGDIRPS